MQRQKKDGESYKVLYSSFLERFHPQTVANKWWRIVS